MICNPCRTGNHSGCPNVKFDVDLVLAETSTGLSPESERVQRSGLCPCQHKASCGCSVTGVSHKDECSLSKSVHGEPVQLVIER